MLDAAREIGLDAVEIAVGDDVSFDPAKTRRRAESLGLELIVSPGALWPAECDLSSDSADDRARGLAWHRRQIDLGGELGAVAYTGALYGHPGAVQRRRPPPDRADRIAEGLRTLAGHAAARGVRLALEPMSRFRTDVANTPVQVMDLIARADHANLAVLLDTYHLVTEVRDYAAAARAAEGRLWGLHACENDRGAPGGGLVPWDALFDELARQRFDGYIGFETYNTSLGDFARRRGLFQDVCPDGRAFLRDAVAFVRRRLPARPDRLTV